MAIYQNGVGRVGVWGYNTIWADNYYLAGKVEKEVAIVTPLFISPNRIYLYMNL